MPVMTQSAPYYPTLAPNCSKHCCVPKAAAWAKPSQSQAPSRGFGPAQGFTKPEPPKAKPKPGLLGQAGPEHHYSGIVVVQVSRRHKIFEYSMQLQLFWLDIMRSLRWDQWLNGVPVRL
jgi:hypothetical protein